MGCCQSNDKIVLKPLRRNSALWAAQQMKVTRSGHAVNFKVVRRAMLQRDADRTREDPNSSDDIKTVFSLPLSACSKLTKYVYLSGIASLTRENLQKQSINLIINATYEWPNVEPEGFTCYRVPVDDSEMDDISIYFDDVADIIEENAKAGGRTLVHCMAGASRSTTLVLAYLVKHERMHLKDAFNSVKKRRETARPNIGFWELLIKFEIRVRGQASVVMINKTVNGVNVKIPDFYEKDYPEFSKREIDKQIHFAKEKQNNPNLKSKSQKQFNAQTNTYE